MVITNQKLARKIRGPVGVAKRLLPSNGQLLTKKDNFDNGEVKVGDRLYIGNVYVGIAMSKPDATGKIQVDLI